MELAYKKQSCTQLNESYVGQEATLAGWASTIRDLGGIIFVELRDKSGLFQLVADPQVNPEVHAVLSKVKPEYVIQVQGKVSKDLMRQLTQNYKQAQLKCILLKLKFYLNLKHYLLF